MVDRHQAVSIIGLGYVGLCTATVFGAAGVAITLGIIYCERR